MSLSEIRDQINQLDSLLDEAESIRDTRRRAELLATATRGAIRGIDVLLRSEWLYRVPLQVENREAWAAIADDEAIARAFIAAECRLLADMGVRPEAVARIRRRLEIVLTEPVADADPRELTRRLVELRDSLEADLVELKQTLETQLNALDDRETTRRFRRRLVGCLEVLGVGAICGANGVLGVVGAPVTGGLSAAGAAISGAAGAGVISDGLGRAQN
jgi:hypothetical protein